MTTDVQQIPLVRLLMGLRSLDWRRRKRTSPPMTLRDATRAGFVLLAENQPHEIVLGIEGRFWQLKPDVCSPDASGFRQPLAPGLARAVWNFSVSPESQ